eukprot:6487985-Amphidinium_carterae.2
MWLLLGLGGRVVKGCGTSCGRSRGADAVNLETECHGQHNQRQTSGPQTRVLLSSSDLWNMLEFVPA